MGGKGEPGWNRPWPSYKEQASPTKARSLALTAILYGIKNCDTVAKARAWLAERSVAYDFHDYKTLGIDAARLKAWCGQFGWEKVLNRSGTTFRKLPDEAKVGLDEAKAIALMVAQPSMIKRPIVEHSQGWLIGFDRQAFEQGLERGWLRRSGTL